MKATRIEILMSLCNVWLTATAHNDTSALFCQALVGCTANITTGLDLAASTDSAHMHVDIQNTVTSSILHGLV